jgi:isoaspartyl peptidase/L-asparaginase-like protein (Ntn-hydrolase superfamily)
MSTKTTFLATWREPGELAVKTAWEKRENGGDLRSCVEAGLAACELDESLLAIGLGALPNAEGNVELDASMMDGATLAAGAVCSVRDIVPVISVARKVMEQTPHVMLAGSEARRFALENGFKAQDLQRPRAMERYKEWVASQDKQFTAKDYIHSTADIDGQHTGDTVTVLAYEAPSHTVAASSTSGIAWKMPGRVGDSPIVGAGIYADDEAGCAGATGLGEELWKACASFRTVDLMGRGMSAQEACDATVHQMLRRQPGTHDIACVVLALRKDGDFGAATTAGEFVLWSCQDGEIASRVCLPPKA